jgi:hypothetical protein
LFYEPNVEATCSPPLLDIGLGRMLFFPVDFGEAIEALASEPAISLY